MTTQTRFTDEIKTDLVERMSQHLADCYAGDVRDEIKNRSGDSFDSVFPELAPSLTDEELTELSDYLRNEVVWSVKVTPIIDQ